MRPSTTITMLDRSNIFFFTTDKFCLSTLLVIAYLIFIYFIFSLYSLKILFELGSWLETHREFYKTGKSFVQLQFLCCFHFIFFIYWLFASKWHWKNLHFMKFPSWVRQKFLIQACNKVGKHDHLFRSQLHGLIPVTVMYNTHSKLSTRKNK